MTRSSRLSILCLALFASLAFAAFASSAEAFVWKIGPEGEAKTLAELELTEESVTSSVAPGTVFTLEGTLLGQGFTLTSTTLSSAGWGGVGNATIYQEGSSAKGKGRLSFSGLTVDKPAGCTVTSPIVTKDLTAEVVEHSTSERAYVKFFPEEGTTFATIVIKGCALAGSYPVKGTVYGEGEPFGTQLASQPLNFSSTINSTLGGTLTLGTSAAKLTGTAIVQLGGANAGQGMGPAPGPAETKLCQEAVKVCKAPKIYAAGELEANAGKSVIELTIAAVPAVKVVITCTEAKFVGKTLAEVGKPALPTEANEMTFANCTAEPGGGACVVSAEKNLEGSFEAGNVVGNGLWNLKAKLGLKCPLPAPQNEVECALVEGFPALTAAGGNPASVFANKKLLTRIVGGANCPSVVEWTPSYTINKPKPMFVTE